MGFSPEVVAYTLYHIGNDVLFPYENNGTLMCYAFGMMSMKQFMKGALTKMVLDFVFVLTLGIFWWSILGLINKVKVNLLPLCKNGATKLANQSPTPEIFNV